jgi:predicted ArsR family transcriptional regulator
MTTTMTVETAIQGATADVVLAELRQRGRVSAGWTGCAELADELGLPKHKVKLALLRLGMDGTAQRAVMEDAGRLTEMWKATPPPSQHRAAAE